MNFTGGRGEKNQGVQSLSVACNLGSRRGWAIYGVMEEMVAQGIWFKSPGPEFKSAKFL